MPAGRHASALPVGRQVAEACVSIRGPTRFCTQRKSVAPNHCTIPLPSYRLAFSTTSAVGWHGLHGDDDWRRGLLSAGWHRYAARQVVDQPETGSKRPKRCPRQVAGLGAASARVRRLSILLRASWAMRVLGNSRMISSPAAMAWAHCSSSTKMANWTPRLLSRALKTPRADSRRAAASCGVR